MHLLRKVAARLRNGTAPHLWSLRSAQSTAGRHILEAVDIFGTGEHFALDVTPDFRNRRVAGTATFTFHPILKPLEQLRLDAVNLEVSEITSAAGIATWENTDKELVITFSKPVPAGQKTILSITYAAEPEDGLYFRTPEMGYDPADAHIWTQGETIMARHWFPCFDAPNEFFTSTMTCRVPKDMVVLSNGRRAGEKIDPATGLKAVTWEQEKPHVNYLITLVAGHFRKLEEKHGNLSLTFWTPPSDFANAANSFRETKQCMEYMEKEIGVPYPWAKYGQVCVQDFNWGGMENTSLTTLNAYTLFSTETENIRSSQGLVAHELAHQWFGDLVTCKDWSHIWLNEGFATYYTHLFAGHKDGRDDMLHGLYRDLKRITGRRNDTTAMVNRKYNAPMEMFTVYGTLSYTKGSWVLHMLRSQLGPDLFRKVVKTYLERHRHGNVVTEDLRSIIEELSGNSFDRFFDQYVYHAHHPELKVDYSWNEKSGLAKLSVAQVQKVDENVMLFEIDLPVRFQVGKKSIRRTLRITRKSEDFYFKLESAPGIVRIDPDLTVLAKVSFSPPNKLVHAQLEDMEDAIGRIQAVELLAKKKDKTTVGKLRHALSNDPFHGVRLAAANALGGIGNDAAFEALAASLKQDDARVRRQVVSNVGSFYKPAALAALREVLKKEKNPAIRASAISSLAGHGDSEVNPLIHDALDSTSFRHQLADAAVSAMRKQDDPANIARLRKALEADHKKFTSRGFSNGLRALAYLARNEKDKSGVRDFLTGHLDSLRKRVQQAAIDSLGQLGDPRAIAVLEKFTAGQDSPRKKSAEQAIEKLRAGRKPVDDFKNLRKEITDLKKANEALSKKLEDLRKQFEATIPDKAKPKSIPKVGKKPGSRK